jgi:hypothetical protein
MALKKNNARRGRERRGSERADANLSMRVDAAAITGTTKIVTESQNISSSGVYCHASHYLAPLSKVQLTIVLPRTPGSTGPARDLVKCDAIVVRCNQRSGDRSGTPYELACMFSGLDPVLKARLEDFVRWRNLQSLRAALAKPESGARTARRTAAAAARRTTAKRLPRVAAPAKRSAQAKRPAAKPVLRAAAARPSGTRRAGRTSR